MGLFLKKEDRTIALNITASGATNIGQARALLLQFGAALTGNVVVATLGSTQYDTTAQTIDTITNPTVGSRYEYGGLFGQGNVTITPSTTCDLTVTKLNNIS